MMADRDLLARPLLFYVLLPVFILWVWLVGWLDGYVCMFSLVDSKTEKYSGCYVFIILGYDWVEWKKDETDWMKEEDSRKCDDWFFWVELTWWWYLHTMSTNPYYLFKGALLRLVSSIMFKWVIFHIYEHWADNRKSFFLVHSANKNH